MKKAVIYVLLAIFFAAAVLGFGFFFAVHYGPALWIGVAGLVLALALYLYDGAMTYKEMHDPSRRNKRK